MNTAIITGASKGIGRAISIKLIDHEINVVLISKTDEDGLKEIHEYANNRGVKSSYHLVDVSDFNAVKAVYHIIKAEFGFVDILINNAGISKYELLSKQTEEDFDELFGVNVKGIFNFTKNVIPDMVKNKYGRIINISSVWGEKGSSMEVLYSATKGAVNSFTKALAKELAPSNVLVNAIAPGVINTKMNAIFSDEEKRELIENIPLGRFGTPEDIANLVAFLVSDKSTYITGQIITVDGLFS